MNTKNNNDRDDNFLLLWTGFWLGILYVIITNQL